MFVKDTYRMSKIWLLLKAKTYHENKLIRTKFSESMDIHALTATVSENIFNNLLNERIVTFTNHDLY